MIESTIMERPNHVPVGDLQCIFGQMFIANQALQMTQYFAAIAQRKAHDGA